MATPAAGEMDTFVAGQSKAAPSKWQGFLTFLYNSKEGTVLGRTGKSWLQITIFYIIFYGVLAAFFAVLLILFLQTLDPNEPKWQQGSGIIGTTPGMGFRPIPPDSGSTLIWVKQTQQNGLNATQTGYINGLSQFLQPYEPGHQDTDGLKNCKVEKDRPVAGDRKACKVDLQQLDVCTKEHNFGYTSGQPCVLLKLNRIFGWKPELYQNNDEAPAALKALWQKQTGKPFNNDPNQLYITCDGEDAVDQEHIGPIKIHPETIPSYYFPYQNQPGYLSPIVMVQFLNVDPGVLINIECKAWAKNIQHSRTDRLGQVHFELLVDR